MLILVEGLILLTLAGAIGAMMVINNRKPKLPTHCETCGAPSDWERRPNVPGQWTCSSCGAWVDAHGRWIGPQEAERP